MSDTMNDVREVLISALDLQQAADDLRPDSPLFGALPELDSLGVLALVTDIEERFGIVIEDDEFGAEMFETLGTLTKFVETKLQAG